MINVSTGLKVPHASDVDREAMAMPHQSSRDVDHANAMGMESVRLAYVIYRQGNAFANTILKDQIVLNAVKIITAIR